VPNDRGELQGLKDNLKSMSQLGDLGTFQPAIPRQVKDTQKAHSYAHIELEETAILPTLDDQDTRSAGMPYIPAASSGHSTLKSLKTHD